MKKLLLIACLVTFGLCSAQPSGPEITYAAVGNLRSTPTHPVIDTITNAVTKIQYGIIKKSNIHATFQATFTKISGTAAATAKLQGSINGTVWSDIGSSYTVTDVASQVASFTVVPSTWQYYRLQVVPTGTQSVKLQTDVLVRQQ